MIIIRSTLMSNTGICLAAVVSALCSGATLAQSIAAATGPEPSSANTPVSTGEPALGEIVVTARRREERLIDVPTAISVVGSDEIARMNITDAKDLTQAVPNLLILSSYAGTGGTIAIRGISSFSANSNPGVSPEAAYNIDGINLTVGRISTLGLLDTDRVEVLEGPQALYFGKNNPAGVVSITSVDPGNSLGGYLRVGYAYHLDAPQMNGALTIPVTDNFSMRVALMAQEQRGYLRNNAVPVVDPAGYAPLIDPGAVNKYTDGSNQVLGRVSAKYTPSDQFTAVIKFTDGRYLANSDGADQVVLCAPGVNNYNLNFGFGYTFTDPADPNCSHKAIAIEGGLNSTLAAHFPGSNGGVPYSANENKLTSLNLNYRLSPITLTSITGYYKMQSNALVGIESSSPFYLGAQSLTYRQASEELRANTTLDLPINFTFGGYYEDSRTLWQGSNYVLPLGPDTVTGRIDSQTYSDVMTDKTYSLFASGDWKLPSNLDLSAGARWTQENKTTTEQTLFLNDQPQLQFGFPFFQPVGEPIVSPTNSSNVSPEVTLTWHVKPDVNIYGAFKTGYKSGGTSMAEVLNITTAAALSFKPETARGGELGIKGEWLDRRLNATFDIYTVDYHNLQLTALKIVPNEPLIFTINNAGGARTQGAEFQTSFQVNHEFALRAHVDYNHAIYTSYANAPCTSDQTAGYVAGCITNDGVSSQDLSGKRIELAPELFAGAGGTYKRPITDNLQIGVDADINYTSSYIRAYGLAVYGEQRGYNLVNASLRLSDPGKGWDLALTGTNLTDEVVYNGMFNINGTSAKTTYSGLLAPPREVALTFSYHF
jgi:iron complex outermembrane recepter protein